MSPQPHGDLNVLHAFWYTIDISDNIHKTTQAIAEVENGIPSLIHALCFALPATLGFGLLAWHFDVAASWTAMAGLRETMNPTITGIRALVSYSFYLLAVLTYMPTIMEMFGARFARFNVFWMQVAVIGLCTFDLFTDLPRVIDFMSQHKGFFLSAGPVIGYLSYVSVFAIWWFFASYGFELLCIICAWAFIGFSLKAMSGPRR